jgi:chitin disaccharide deacetylase
MAKRIVIQGDDWGYTNASIEGIGKAYCNGILTETDIMANLLDPAKKSEYRYQIDSLENKSGLKKPKLGLGVHLNLTYGHPITETWPFKEMARPYKGTGKPEEWQGSAWARWFAEYKSDLIRDELRAQLERALDIFGDIDHLDAHHFVHSYEPIKTVVLGLAKEYGIKYIRATAPLSEKPVYGGDFMVDTNLRNELIPLGLKTTDTCHLKLYWNEKNSLEAFLADVAKVEDGKTTEFMFHPAVGGTEEWRNKDLDILINPQTLEFFQKNEIELVNYSGM